MFRVWTMRAAFCLAAAQANGQPAHQLCRGIVSGDSPVQANERPSPHRDLVQGCLALRNRDWDRAVDAFSLAVSRDSTNAVNHFWLARGMGEQVRRGNALRAAAALPAIRRHASLAVALDSTFVDARVFMIEILLRAPAFMGGSIDAASKQVDSLARQNRYAASLAAVQVMLARRDSSAAERSLREVTQTHPDSAAPHVALLNLYLARGRLNEILPLVEALGHSARLRSLSDFYRGRVSAVTGRDLPKGEAALRKYLAQPRLPGFPSHAFGWLHLGTVLLKSGRVSDARAAWTEALRLDPDLEEARTELDRTR